MDLWALLLLVAGNSLAVCGGGEHAATITSAPGFTLHAVAHSAGTPAIGQPTERLHIEGVSLGMTAAQFSKALEEKGWVDEREATRGSGRAPSSLQHGQRGHPAFRGMTIRYAPDPSDVRGPQRVDEVNLLMPMAIGRDLATVVPDIQKVFDKYVALYGKPDACEPHRRHTSLFGYCTWTRRVDGAPQTLHWQIGRVGPALRLAAGPSRLKAGERGRDDKAPGGVLLGEMPEAREQ